MDKNLQRIDLKVFLDAPEGASYDSLLTVFDRWRKEEDAPSDWVDLADYAHMAHGPVVLMAGKRENFGVDTNVPGPGLLVQNRKDLDGTIEERFLEAFRRHLTLATRLVGEAEWPAGLAARGGSWRVEINDRLQFPNEDSTDEELRTGLIGALDRLFDGSGYTATRETNPQSRYGYRVEAEGNPTLHELLRRIS